MKNFLKHGDTETTVTPGNVTEATKNEPSIKTSQLHWLQHPPDPSHVTRLEIAYNEELIRINNC